MRAVRNNPNRAHNYFQDFSKCLSIFNKALKLQKNRKRKQNRKREKEKGLPGAHPAGPPAGPAQPPLQRAAWLGQAGKQLLDGEHSMRATQLPAASPLPSSSCRRGTNPLSLPDLADTRSPLWLLSLALPDVARDVTVAAARCSRVQRRPRALSPCPDGSPSSTTSTSQAARRRSPCIIPAAVVFNLGPPEIAVAVPTAPSLPRAH